MLDLRQYFISQQNAVCLLSAQSVTCYASRGRQKTLNWDSQEINQSLEILFSCLQDWRVRYLTLLLDTSDETLFYEQTPRLYFWEINRYAQRQTAKRFSHLQGITGYRYVRLGRSAIWQAESYLLLSFSVSESTLVAQAWQALLSRLSGQNGIWLVSVLSLSLLLADDTYRVSRQEKQSKTVAQTQGRLWLLSWQAGQVRQLLCYRGLLLIHRSLTFINENPEDQAKQLVDENQLLIRFLHTQTTQGIQVDSIDHRLHRRDLLLDQLIVQQVKQFPKRSDYHPFRVLAWQRFLAWQKGVMVMVFASLLMAVIVSVVFHWQTQSVEQNIDQLTLDLQRNQKLFSQKEDMDLSPLMNVTPEQVQARVAWMQSWHRLKMTLDPSPVLTQLAEVLVRFPAIQITAIAYHNGPPNSASGEVLDMNHASLRLTAKTDAQAFHNLAEEENLLQAFIQALARITRVRQVELLGNPVLTLINKPMTLAFAQSAEETVTHPLLLVLHLQADADLHQSE